MSFGQFFHNTSELNTAYKKYRDCKKLVFYNPYIFVGTGKMLQNGQTELQIPATRIILAFLRSGLFYIPFLFYTENIFCTVVKYLTALEITLPELRKL